MGATQILLGTPGDLPETVKNIHEKGFVPPEQAPSMFVVSAFSIAAGEQALAGSPSSCSSVLEEAANNFLWVRKAVSRLRCKRLLHTLQLQRLCRCKLKAAMLALCSPAVSCNTPGTARPLTCSNTCIM